MNMPTPTVGAAPWYTSQVYIGAVITVLSTILGLAPKVAQALNLTNPGTIATTVTSVFQVIALIAGIFTAVKRQNSTIQPLTLTADSAANHPATLSLQRGPQ
jgi:uncharacterized membrane protein YqjE